MSNQSLEGAPKKGNLQKTFSSALIYLKYVRMMVLLLSFALALGISYYIFARSVYYSRALVDYKVLGLPIDTATGQGRSVQAYMATRALTNQLNSTYLTARVAERLGLVEGTAVYGSVRDEFIKKSQVSLLDDNTLMIEVWPYYPELSTAWPEAMIEEYLDYQANLRRDQREHALERYEDELVAVKEKLDLSLERKIDFEEKNMFTETFIAQNQLTEVPREMVHVKHRLGLMDEIRPKLKDPSLGAVEKLSIMESFAKAESIDVGAIVRSPEGSAPIQNARSKLLGEMSPEFVVIAESMTELEEWQRLESDYRRLREEIVEASKKYGPGHRIMVELEESFRDVEIGIDRELSLALERFDLEYLRLNDRLASLESKLPEYREVSRKFDEFRQNYSLLEKGELAWDKAHIELSERIAAYEFVGDKERIDLSYLGLTQLRNDPVSPNKAKLIYASMALGLALAVFIPFGLEFFNDTSHRIEEIEQDTGLPGIGLVPLCDSQELENVARSPLLDSRVPMFLLESFRIIRSHISLNKVRDDEARVIMVSSARPSEGKTTQAANLAWAFTSAGERTIVVDTDLRRGRMHGVLDLPNDIGMTTTLAGKTTWQEAVQKTPVPNLEAITRGPVIAGTTEILCKREFGDLIEDLKLEYDRVILDTPPVLGLSETTSLQRVTDGVVLVIRAEKTPKRDVRSAIAMLHKAGANFYGFVLNQVDLSKPINYYNYYYYSSDYYDEFQIEAQSGDLELVKKPS